jgi:hypothetical protein
LRAGDVLLRAGDVRLLTLADLRGALAQAKNAGRDFVLIRLSREGDEAFVTLPVTP